MLNGLDVEKLFAACQSSGFENPELYVEDSQIAHVLFQGRSDAIRFETRQGMSLAARKNGTLYHFLCDGFSLAPLFAQLSPSLGAPPAAHEPAKRANPAGDAVHALLQTFRNAFSTSNELLQFPLVQAVLVYRRYQVARETPALVEGQEENAEVLAQWQIGEPSRRQKWERARGSVTGLLAEVNSSHGLARAVRQSLSTQTRWPAPNGQVPILWSARSVAKIQMLFLRAFEGDRVIDNRSFLNELAVPNQFTFTVEDRPAQAGVEVDHEGSLRKSTVLFREGRPTALACNKKLAQQLEVPPTGHARRQSFDLPATVGFWHLHLEGKKTHDTLLPLMAQGISVREMEVLSYDAATGDLELLLNESYLVHQGVEGEPIEPLLLKTSLADLLESFQEFGKERLTTGLVTKKDRQRLFTEITTPAALSRPLQLPGSVPNNHYW
jgi:hypothetical protein